MKKVSSILLCLMMLFSYIPAGTATTEEINPLPQIPADYAASDYAKYAMKMAVGKLHAAAIKPDGTVVAWGDDTYGQCDVPAGLTGVKAIAAGNYHTLALKEDGSLVGWGTGYDDTANMVTYTIPAELQGVKVKLIAAGSSMSAAVKEDSRVVVWGYNSNLTTIPADLGNVVAMAINGKGVVALNDEGKITAWGDSNCTTLPADLTQGNVVAVAAGTWQWMALENTGKVDLWGYDGHIDSCGGITSQANVQAIASGKMLAAALLADGTIVCYGNKKPAGFDAITNVMAISTVVEPNGSGASNLCAVQKDGAVIACGPIAGINSVPAGLNLITMTSSDNNANLSGLAVAGYDLNPAFAAATTEYAVNIPNNVSSVDVTATTADIAVTLKINGTAVTSGSAKTVDNLVVGDNTVTVEVTAKDGATVKTYTLTITRAAAAQSNNADLSSMTVAGYVLDKTFDAGTTAYVVNTPNAVSSVDITATTSDTSATLKINGTVATSGIAQAISGLVIGDNQVSVEVTAGDGTTVKTYTLTIKRASLENAVWRTPAEYAASTYGQLVGRIAGGRNHAAAVLTDETVEAWGDNSYGQLELPATLTGVKALVAGKNHTLALKTDGSLIAWGANNYGQCNIPADLKEANVKAIAAMVFNSAALTMDNKIYVWGNNISNPIVLDSGQNINSIAMDPSYVLALTEYGVVTAWDRKNNYQQCSVPDGFGSNVVAITAGNEHALALKADGSVVSWGNDYYTQTYPVPEELDNVRAIAAGDNAISAALTADGNIAVWGYSCFDLFSIPTNLNQVQGVSAGEISLYAVQNDGAIVPWGSNDEGQFDVPAGLNLYSQISSNNLLCSLKVEKVVNDGVTDNVTSCSITPEFSSARTEGAVDLANNIKEVRITAQLFSSAATLQINRASAVAGVATVINGQNLVVGDNPVSIKVTAQNGNERTYTLHIKLISEGGFVLPQTPQEYQASEYASYRHKIAAGQNHVLALKKDGTVACWGNGGKNQCNTPAGLEDVTVVAAGMEHSLALKKDGTIVGWGSNEYGQCDAPTGLSKVVDIAAGRSFSAAVDKNGSVYVWGENNSGQCNVPAGLSNVVDVECGNNGVLALKTDGTVITWGSNTSGECNVPVGLDHVVSIAAGLSFNMALNADGTVVAWGAITNDSEQGGASSLQYVKAITAGSDYAVALKWDGSLFAFDNDQKVSVDVAPFSAKKVLAISANSLSGSLIALNEDGTVTGGGVPSWVNLLEDDPAAYSGPAPNIPQTPAAYAESEYTQAPAKICALSNGVLVLNMDGTVKAVLSGNDGHGLTPVPLELNHVKAIDRGQYYGIALKDDGTVVVWGEYASDQKKIPENLGKVTAIASCAFNCLALQEDGTVAAWGANDFGECDVPASLSGVTAIAADWEHCLALKNDGTVVAWGANDYGQSEVPEGLSDVARIYATTDNSIALKNDGTVVVWGRNDKSQCEVPEGLSGVVNVTNYNSTFIAQKSNGTLVAWGDNSYGRRYVAPDIYDVTYIEGLTAVKADGSIVDLNNNTLASLSHVLTISNSIVIFRDGTLKYLNDDSNTDLDGLNVISGHYFAITKAELLNPAGQSISSVVSQGGYRIKAQVANNYAETTTGLVIIQVRGGNSATGSSGGQVLGCVGLSSEIPVTGTTASSDFTLPAGISGNGYVDVFVWDGWDTMVPRAEANQDLSFSVTE